jgi:tRNA(adenine34) deaminase
MEKKYMELAMQEAQVAYDNLEVPIGAVIVCDGQVIAKTHNTRESCNQAVHHAEMLAIMEANKKLNSWRLDTCTLYVTIEPCPMCAGAILQSRIKKVVYGASDPKAGAHQSKLNLFSIDFNHKTEVISGIMEEESKELMQKFFQNLRK